MTRLGLFSFSSDAHKPHRAHSKHRRAPSRRPRAAGAAILAALLFALALAPAAAQADFGLLPGAAGFDAAAVEAGGTADSEAGTHPYAMRVHLGFDTTGGGAADGNLRDLSLALPPGLLANPAALAECTQAQFHTPRVNPLEPGSLSGESCPDASQVGVAALHSGYEGGSTRWFGVFNLVAPNGSAEAIGLAPFGQQVTLTARVREPDAALVLDLADFPAAPDLRSLDLTLWGTPWEAIHDGQRGNCLQETTGTPGALGNCHVVEAAVYIHSYLTLPSSCAGPLRWELSARPWQPPAAPVAAAAESRDEEGHPLPLGGCVEPLAIAKVQLRTESAASPTGLLFDVDVNDGGGFLNPAGIVRSPIRTAVAALPEGLTLNPSLGAGLGVCAPADFARESAASAPGAGCPNASKIGGVEIEGLLGLPEPVRGSVFLAKPYENPAGSLLALYIVAASARRGLFLKATGEIDADPRSGRLTVTFEGLPQLHYTHFTLDLREGQRAALISPPACGSYVTALELRPYSDPATVLHESSTLPVSHGEGGGPCPAGAARPFHPGLVAGSVNPNAGSYSPFHLRMTRTDAEQEIASYSATFPPGLLAKLAGVGECPDAAIVAAAGRSGAEQLAAPSCPASSLIGDTLAGYGVGQVLAYAPGKLYLAGPWHGAPLSTVAIDSALVGPFDLGTVVVRSAIRIDPRTAQASIDSSGSDPIPHILKGIPLHLRDIRVHVDRPGFTLNPTSCDVLAVFSTLTGAGADLSSAADDPTATASQRFQLLNCSALRFRPRLALRLRGSTRHGGYPSLRATYVPRPGDANLRSAAVTLPPSLFLAQEHVGTVCTGAQFAAGRCPRGSVYGHARALTPLLDEPLEGPVYLRSSANAVPDLVASLHGRGIAIEVVGRIDSSHGGLRATFEGLPDAPVTSFAMTLAGRRRALLVNAKNLCAAPRRATARLIAADNATESLHPKLKLKCKQKHPKHRPPRRQLLLTWRSAAK